MRATCTALCLLIFAGASSLAADAPATRPVPAVTHVVIVSIDGLRPDLALRAEMPHLRALMARGSFSFWAKTTDIAVTLPSHVSMLTGVTPDKHGILWNDSRADFTALKVPTLFDRAKAAGLTAAFASAKTKFKLFDNRASVDHAFWPPTDVDNDRAAAAKAAEFVVAYKPNVLFVHLGEVDAAGHGIGWGSPEQMAAIGRADASLGVVLAAVDAAGLASSTAVIVSADHGGSGRAHGKDDVRSRYIPWVCAGPGIGKDVDLTKFRDRTIATEDTFATACWMLGIDPGPNVDGKPVTEVLEAGELMRATP